MMWLRKWRAKWTLKQNGYCIRHLHPKTVNYSNFNVCVLCEREHHQKRQKALLDKRLRIAASLHLLQRLSAENEEGV